MYHLAVWNNCQKADRQFYMARLVFCHILWNRYQFWTGTMFLKELINVKCRRCTIVASSYLSKSRISNFKLDIKKKMFPLNCLHIYFYSFYSNQNEMIIAFLNIFYHCWSQNQTILPLMSWALFPRTKTLITVWHQTDNNK